MRKHKVLFDQLWEAFVQVATHAVAHGNHVALEWPRPCAYWLLPKVLKLKENLKLISSLFDGCALGLVSKVGGNPLENSGD